MRIEHVDLCIGLLHLVVHPSLKPTTKVVGMFKLLKVAWFVTLLRLHVINRQVPTSNVTPSLCCGRDVT
jgi:hypothetical protein